MKKLILNFLRLITVSVISANLVGCAAISRGSSKTLKTVAEPFEHIGESFNGGVGRGIAGIFMTPAILAATVFALPFVMVEDMIGLKATDSMAATTAATAAGVSSYNNNSLNNGSSTGASVNSGSSAGGKCSLDGEPGRIIKGQCQVDVQ